MCRLLGVSTAGFYDYLKRGERPDDPDRLKLLSWQHCPTRQAAQNDIVDYIAMFYNPLRLHSYLD